MGKSYDVKVGTWRNPTYSEEAGDMSGRPRLDFYCGGSKWTVRDGWLLDWRIGRAKRRVVRMEKRRRAQHKQRQRWADHQ